MSNRRGAKRRGSTVRKRGDRAPAASAGPPVIGGMSWTMRLFYIFGVLIIAGSVGAGVLVAVLGDPRGNGDNEPDIEKGATFVSIDPSKSYTAILKTEKGDITIKLRPDLAPKHVDSFVTLARKNFFDGVTFHRVIPGFVAQTGDPTGTGTGGPGYTIEAEFTKTQFVAGTIGMARSNDPNSAGSQFFITYERAPHLDGQYTVFGEVTQGMDVARKLTPREAPSAPPGDKLIDVEIIES